MGWKRSKSEIARALRSFVKLRFCRMPSPLPVGRALWFEPSVALRQTVAPTFEYGARKTSQNAPLAGYSFLILRHRLAASFRLQAAVEALSQRGQLDPYTFEVGIVE